ncbi:MAG: hypothetical protein NZ556_02995 [Fimbriimonadales bacterium]|nr:hypothetical protein [Fimbriimonadales bacterium]
MKTRIVLTALTTAGLAMSYSQLYSPFDAPCRCPDTQQPVSQDFAAINIDNEVLGATIGLRGTIQWNRGCFPEPGSGCITYNARGSIQIGTVRGGGLLGDANIAMTAGYPWPVIPGGGIYITLQTVRDGQTQTIRWGVAEPRFEISYPGASGSYIYRRWDIEGLDTELRVDLIQNVARISLSVWNTGSSSLNLSMRLSSDPEVGPEENIFPVPSQNLPALYVYAAGQRPVRTDKNLFRRRNEIPEYIDIYRARSNLAGSSRYLLRPTAGFPDQTTVDRLVIGEWFFIHATADWLEEDSPRIFPDSLIDDVALNMYVLDRTLPANMNRSQPPVQFVFYVMLTPGTYDVQPPLAVGVESLPVVEPDQLNLTKLANEGVFEIVASVTNQFFVIGREVDLRDVTLDLSLPKGINLLPGQQRRQVIPQIPPGRTETIRWRVKADPDFAGFASFQVSVQAPPAPNKTVRREILISATANRSLQQGFQLVSIPFRTRGTIADILSNLPTNYQARRWNPQREQYELIDSIQPGEGFWLFIPSNAQTVLYNPDALEFPSGAFNNSVSVPLRRGWNQIGNPYPYPLVLGQAVVVRSSDPRRSLSLSEAAAAGALRGVIYYWDEFSQEYKFTSDPQTPILPHRGYWVKVNEDMEFVFPPVFLPGTGAGGGLVRSASETNTPSHWRLQIVARTRNGADTQNFIGLSNGRSAGDVEEPPTPLPQRPVNLTILKSGTGAPLMQEIRPLANRQQFNLQVEAGAGEEVTLTFPNLNTIPQGYRLRLTDMNTGRTVDLRTTPEYRFVSTGRTRLQITVERAARGGALITSLNVGSAGRGASSVSISYVLADNAQTSIQILSADGRPVANLHRGRAATRGVNTVAWNLRDDAGRAVPPGTYQVQVEARTEDGQTARAVRPLVLTR